MRVRVLLVSMLTMASIVSFGQPRPGRAAPRAISATSAESGIWGGGFVNALGGPSPATSTFLAGGDVSGISKLNSSTANWATSNRGLYDAYQLQIASIEFRRGSTTEAYAAFGDGNDNHLNGILKTGNAGDDWALFASNTAVPDLVFNARSPANDYGVESPRATGDLMVLDDWSVTNKLNIYAGSYRHGLLWRNPTTGAWRTIAFGTQNGPGKCPVTTSPCFITTVVAEPAHADVLFVGIHRLDGGDGLWKVTNPRCGSTDCATISAITSSTGGHIPTPEELLDLGTALYCACGSGSSTGGFYYSLTYPFSSMTQNNAGLGFSQTRTTSYPAIARTSNGTLYLGAFNSNCVQTGCQTVFRATGPTGTWSDRIAQGSIQTLVAGTTDG